MDRPEMVAATPSKKKFIAPQIVEFGDIAGITATGCTVPGSDVMGGSVGHSKNPGKGKGTCTFP